MAPSRHWLKALCVNVLLLGLFAAQHSVMARRAFKRWWTRIVPPVVERSTYVLAASIALALLFWLWLPIPVPIIWRIDNPAAAQLLWAVFWLGWALVLVSTFLINHFELFGLQQVFARLTGREMPCTPAHEAALLQLRASSPLSRPPAQSLGGAGHDGRALAVLDRGHQLHLRRHLVRRTRPHRPIRRALPPLSG